MLKGVCMINIDFSAYEETRPKVEAVVCPTCGKLHYPAPMICDRCNTRRDPSGARYSRWETTELEGDCTLLTWTRVHALPDGFDIPFLQFGIVEFSNGLRASGLLKSENPEIGMQLTAIADVVRETGNETEWGLVFVA